MIRRKGGGNFRLETGPEYCKAPGMRPVPGPDARLGGVAERSHTVGSRAGKAWSRRLRSWSLPPVDDHELRQLLLLDEEAEEGHRHYAAELTLSR